MDKENKFNKQPQDEVLNDDVQEIKEDTSEDLTADSTEVEENPDNKKDKKDKKEKKENKVKKLFKSRKFKKGGLSIAFTAVFIVVVIVINMIANLVTTRVPALTFDLSALGTYELSQDTIDFIKTVNKDVTITVLAKESDYTAASEYYLKANTLLKQYRNFNNKINIKYVDLTSNPTFVNNYPDENLSGGNYIVSCGDNYRILSTDDLFETQVSSDYSSYEVTGLEVEPAVTTAILNVTSENQTKVQFISGYGDYNAEKFTNLLKQNNYDVSNVSLLTQEIDKDAEAVILYMPTVDLDETTINKIKTFLNNNGNYGKDFIYMVHPEKKETPNLDTFLEEWGMKLGKGIVAELDTSKLISQTYYYSLLDYSNTEYTDGLKDATLSMIGGYIIPVEITNSNMATSLLQTSTSAKLIPSNAGDDFDIDSVEAQQYNAAAIGTQTSGNDEKSNVVVFGSSIVFSDNAISMSSANNGAYIINMFNKLTENTDEGITVDGKDLSKPSLGITTDQINGISSVCMFGIPIVIIIFAIVIWVRRRNR